MTKPYLLVSDLHFHNWSPFATIDPKTGRNTRLQIQLNELSRAVKELKDAAGDTIVYAGDLFHIRGSVDPEVFNPVHDLISRFSREGFRQEAIPGNHDLKGAKTTTLGNAFQSFGELPHFDITTSPDLVREDLAMIPWQENKAALRHAVEELKKSPTITTRSAANIDLVIHAGIDGVIAGLPDHGLSSAEVASWGFRRVFAGDYHHHKIMEGGKVISIGALTHQTWSDIGARAGFLLVYPDRVEYRASHAPGFVEITGDDDPAEWPILADRNYVRVRSMKLTEAEVNEARRQLLSFGALGVQFQIAKEQVAARGPATKAASLEESVASYVGGMPLDPHTMEEVKARAANVLAEARSVAA